MLSEVVINANCMLQLRRSRDFERRIRDESKQLVTQSLETLPRGFDEDSIGYSDEV